MGGKKKSLANKLAKMSDEDRARYLQRKADIEEEARRRKQQLITAFMKNKIKKEDAFSRLNLAKINQQWHQILRLAKCKEMKENCEHLRRWIERVINIKNRTIDNLVKELDEAEFQYSNNLQAHLKHVDDLTEFHNDYLGQLKRTYEEDRDFLVTNNADETRIYLENIESDFVHLKTLLYGQELNGGKEIKYIHEYYLKRNEEYVKACRSEFDQLRKDKEGKASAIWRDIAVVVNNYIEHTDKRRAHLAELGRIDAESAAEIISNQERINYEQEQIEKLKKDYTTIVSTRKETVRSLQEITDNLAKRFLKMKRQLQSDLMLDEKRLMFLTDASNQTSRHLGGLVRKGENLLHLIQNCRKYETQREKVTRWMPMIEDSNGEASSRDDDNDDSRLEDDSDHGLEGKIFFKKKADSLEEKSKSSEDASEVSEMSGADSGNKQLEKTKKYKYLLNQKYRPKIDVRKKTHFGEKLKAQLALISPVPESSTCIKRITLSESKKNDRSKQKQSLSSSSSSLQNGIRGSEIIENTLESLFKIDGLWLMYNRVALDCRELRGEKRCLSEENKMLKDTIRNILENAALMNGMVHQDTVCPKARIVSAPVKNFS